MYANIKEQTNVLILDRDGLTWPSITGEVTDNLALVAYVEGRVTLNVSDAVDTLNGRINKINNKIATINGKLVDADNKIDNTKAALEGQISTLTEKVKTDVDRMDGDITALQNSLSTKVAEINTEINTLKSSYNTSILTITNSINGINTSITQIGTLIADIQTGITGLDNDLNEKIDAANTLIDGLDARLSAAETGLSSANTKITNINTAIAGINTDITGIKNRVTTAEGEITGIKNRVTTAEDDITDIEDDITDIKNTHTEYKTATDNHLGVIDGRLDEAESSIETFKQKNTAYDARLNSLDSSVTDLYKENASIKSDITGIKSNVSTINNTLNSKVDKSNLPSKLYGTDENGEQTVLSFATLVSENTEIVGIHNTINTLNSELDEARTDISGVEVNINGIKTSITEINTGVDDIKTDVTGINNKIKVVEADITGINKEVDDIKSDITDIKSKATTAEDNIAEITTDVADVKTEIDDIKDEMTVIDGKFGNYAKVENLQTIIKEVGIIIDYDAIKFRKTYLNSSNGSTSLGEMNMPQASASKAGVMTKESFIQMQQNTADIQALKGANRRYPVNNPLPSTLTQAEVKAIFNTVSGGKTVADGDTLISFNSSTMNFGWSYFASDSQWHYRGLDTVMQASQTDLGIVKGDEVDGKIFVEGDGTMSLVGYDQAVGDITEIKGSYMPKVSATNILYGTDGAGEQKYYAVGPEIPLYANGKLQTALPESNTDAANKQYVDNMFSSSGLSADEVTLHLENNIIGLVGDYKAKADNAVQTSNTNQTIGGTKTFTVSPTVPNKNQLPALENMSVIATEAQVANAVNSIPQPNWDQTGTSAKDYIRNKPTIPAAQIPGDWNQTVTSAKDFIKNKPTIPTNISQLANDSNYAQDASYNHTDNNFTDELKGKLEGVEVGAESNVQPDWNQTEPSADSFIKNKPANIVQDGSYNHTDNNFTTAFKNKLENIAAGADVSIQSDWNQTVTSAKDFINNKPTIPTKTSQLTNDSNYAQDASYNHTDNNFTDELKNKLEGVEAGAEPNVQPDWNQTEPSADSFIKNKPANIVQDGSYKHTDNNFTTAFKNKLENIAAGADVSIQSDWNQTVTSAKDFINNKPTIPTKTSQLTNDSNYAQDASYNHTDNNFTTTLKNKLDAIEAGANKYIHPAGVTLSSGMYKITVNSLGHITGGVAVTKGDITALGIPGEATVYTVVKTGSGNAVTDVSISSTTITVALGETFVPASKMQLVSALPSTPDANTFYFIPE